MAKKDEKVFIQIDNDVIELTGKDLEAYLKDREEIQTNLLLLEETEKTQKELKISAYKKLGLTDEEIQAII